MTATCRGLYELLADALHALEVTALRVAEWVWPW